MFEPLRFDCNCVFAKRRFRFRLKTPWILAYPQSTLRRLRSDCADAQADLSIRWAHMQSCRKSLVLTHVISRFPIFNRQYVKFISLDIWQNLNENVTIVRIYGRVSCKRNMSHCGRDHNFEKRTIRFEKMCEYFCDFLFESDDSDRL